MTEISNLVYWKYSTSHYLVRFRFRTWHPAKSGSGRFPKNGIRYIHNNKTAEN